MRKFKTYFSEAIETICGIWEKSRLGSITLDYRLMRADNSMQTGRLKLRWIFLAPLIMAVSSCDIIPENERIVEIQQVPPNKTVLVMEFTDQRCVNCPAAAEVIESLHQEYGDKLVSVSIHANPLFNLPLENETSNFYENFYQVTAYGHPAAIVDRRVNINRVYEEWSTMVRNEIQNEALADIQLVVTTDTNAHSIQIISEIRDIHLSSEDASNLHLQLWLTEDSIVSKQLMANAQYNYDYMHRHVFRSAANGNWGKSIVLETGETLKDTCICSYDPSWKVKNLSVVGFVYSGEAYEQVLQTKEKKLF